MITDNQIEHSSWTTHTKMLFFITKGSDSNINATNFWMSFVSIFNLTRLLLLRAVFVGANTVQAWHASSDDNKFKCYKKKINTNQYCMINQGETMFHKAACGWSTLDLCYHNWHLLTWVWAAKLYFTMRFYLPCYLHVLLISNTLKSGLCRRLWTTIPPTGKLSW